MACATAASACAWLPADAATTPAAHPLAPRAASLAPTPRTLKEPVRWRFSAFSATTPPARSENVRVERTGVRRAVEATAGRAAPMSSAVTSEDSSVATRLRLQRVPPPDEELPLDRVRRQLERAV